MSAEHAPEQAQPAAPAAERRTPGPGEAPAAAPRRPPAVQEIGGPSGPEPTRYGDWEKDGRCSDF